MSFTDIRRSRCGWGIKLGVCVATGVGINPWPLGVCPLGISKDCVGPNRMSLLDLYVFSVFYQIRPNERDNVFSIFFFTSPNFHVYLLFSKKRTFVL